MKMPGYGGEKLSRWLACALANGRAVCYIHSNNLEGGGGMKTLKEIAGAAGVSVTTVSNVINGNHKRVSRETVARIQALIDASGYIPNQAARSLAQRGSRFVAVVIQAGENENALAQPYLATYVGALTVNLYHNGYYPLIRFTEDFHTMESDLKGWNVAGAVFNGTFTRMLQQMGSLSTVPCVFTDCYFDLPGVNHVGVDDDAGGRLAGEYLRRMGHRRAGFIGNALPDSELDQHRLESFREGLGPDGVVRDEWILPKGDPLSQGARLDAMLRAPERPTAFFCSADRIAVELMRVLAGLGWRVPEDVSVIGFDDLPMARLSTPQLTTLAQDIDLKARMAVDMLVRHIRDRSLPPERAALGVTLVERESVARIDE